MGRGAILWREVLPNVLPVVLDVREPWELQTASVKAAGFKSIRIPCAWYSHTESDSLTIKPAWIAPMVAPSTTTLAWRTRCSRAIMRLT